MKKSLLFSFACCVGAFASASNDTPVPNRGCGTMEHLQMQIQQDPGLADRMNKIELDMQAWIANSNKNPVPHAVIKIPTVVHVVYSSSSQNLSDTYIQQQIDVLNKDYRKLNSDWSSTPSVFQSLVADCEIEFCLASKDPSGNTTNGIVRKSTSTSSWTTNDAVKYTSSGGSDAWNSSQYLNIWCCNLGSGLLGYAQFPGGSAATDGVVILYSSFPGPPSAAPYDLGRTATHEVGHWLNLRHIWGDANCGNDLVSDTPTQQTANYSCPTHPHVTCSNVNGDMFMNYMDYVDDACMYMFTAGQKARMQSCLASSRSGLGPAAATKCTSTGISEELSSDLISVYPNPSSGEVTIGAGLLNLNTLDLVIYNALGEAVITRKITIPSSGEAKVDLNNNPDGIYLMELKTAKGTITKKMVINR